MTAATSWNLRGFEHWLDRWRAEEDPPTDLVFAVSEWMLTRMADPYQGAQPDPGQPDLWFSWIPGTGDGCGNVMACSYRIDPVDRTVTCNILGSLRYP